ncbi:MAG: cysteine desulfurase family protein [bacterium]|jgi:cysteine desulfurase
MMDVYLDHNATTPVHPEVFQSMAPYLKGSFGNASCLYQLGVDAAYAVEKARMQVGQLINATPEEIVFTSGGTESDNLALQGVILATEKKHIITSAIEHPAVMRTCEFLMKYSGCRISYLPVDQEGRVDLARIEQEISPETALISIMFANNEIGTVQPIAEIARIARRHDVLFHTDAVQAAAKLPIDVQALDVDLLSISGHKFYGPKGVGALYVRKGVPLVPQVQGGGQENGLRGGTENVAGIVGLGKAADLALQEMADRAQHALHLTELLWLKLEELPISFVRHSPVDHILPGTVNFTIPGINAREFVRAMDEEGFAIATGSACSTGKTTPSYVIKAIGKSDEEAGSSIRVSLGINNTEEQINRFVESIPVVIGKIRES